MAAIRRSTCGGVDAPRGDEAVGRRPAVQRAARLTVDVLFVLLDDDAELGEVEVGVGGLERVVGPLDEVQPHGERGLALGQLQARPEAGGAHLRRHAQHVRPLRRPAVLDRRHRVHEPAHPPAIVEGAQQDAAALDRDDEHRRRDDVLGVGVSPDGLFEGGHVAAFLERRERTDVHQRRAGNSRSDVIFGTSVGQASRWADGPERETRTARIPIPTAPAMSAGTLSPTIIGFARRDADLPQRRLEDAAMRLHVTVVVGRDRGRKDALEREVRLKRGQRALRVRDQADLQSRRVQRPQDLRDVFIHLEVVA